jgi:hypothetical protein
MLKLAAVVAHWYEHRTIRAGAGVTVKATLDRLPGAVMPT